MLLRAMENELVIRSNELANDEIKTIYFGGGTPSVLSADELKQMLVVIKKHYQIHEFAEITIEVNPDDLSLVYLQSLFEIGLNRLSMGIQSFSDNDLKLMNRRHTTGQAIQAVDCAKEADFTNISIDLIFGLPGQSLEAWKHNIECAIALDVQHISAYNLTYHEGTVFYERLKKGMLRELPDELSLSQFKLLIDLLTSAGFEQYEISNFCKPGYYSRHNSSYWKNEKYLGIGPSAHSFDLVSRRWNVASVRDYIDGIENGKSYSDNEILSLQDRYNDYIITGLRTIRGVSANTIEKSFPGIFFQHFKECRAKYAATGHLILKDDALSLSKEGLFISDQIMADFMVVEVV
jgi:oxygen-independent coproporphyrinogen-3 oxidase